MGILSKASNIQIAATATVIASLVSVLIFLLGDGILLRGCSWMPPLKGAVQQTTVEDDVTLEITALRRSGSNLVIDYRVTSNSRNQEWLLYGWGRTRIITGSNEYKCTMVSLGDRTHSSDAQNHLIEKVSLTASTTFKDFPSEINTIEALQIKGRYNKNGWMDWDHTFKDLVIE